MKGFAFMLRIGSWKLTHNGLLHYRRHQNKSGKTKWMNWDRVVKAWFVCFALASAGACVAIIIAIIT